MVWKLNHRQQTLSLVCVQTPTPTLHSSQCCRWGLYKSILRKHFQLHHRDLSPPLGLPQQSFMDEYSPSVFLFCRNPVNASDKQRAHSRTCSKQARFPHYCKWAHSQASHCKLMVEVWQSMGLFSLLNQKSVNIFSWYSLHSNPISRHHITIIWHVLIYSKIVTQVNNWTNCDV